MKDPLHKVDQILSGFYCWLLLKMIILLVIDIFSRAIARPIKGMTEFSAFVVMAVIYLGLASCEEHMGLFIYLLALMTIGIFLYALIRNTITSLQSEEALSSTVELSFWPVNFIMLIGLVFFWIQIPINAVMQPTT